MHPIRTIFLSATLFAAIFVASIQRVAVAEVPSGIAAFSAMEVPDMELSQVRGKYVSSGQISYFGIQMYSQWETAQGDLHNGGLALQVDLTGSDPALAPENVSVFMFGQLINGTWTPGAAPLSGSGTGLDNVHGVSQGIQVAGDGNSVLNDTWVNVQINATDSPLIANGMEKVLVNGAGTQTITEADGGTTTATVANDGFGIVIAVPGQGQVTQRIQGGSGLQQSAEVNSSFNTIRNIVMLDIGFQIPSTATGINISSLQDALRGLPSY